jgi:transcriptional regulator with XRE-family HTH domain
MTRRPGPAQSVPIGTRELQRRHRQLCVRVGAEIAELRAEAGISQSALAAAAGIDQGYLSRIERGQVCASLEILIRIAACLGADLGVRLFPTSGPRLRDRFQAPMIECLIRALHPRWARSPEVQVAKARGRIDLALGLRTGDLAIACEAHSEFRAMELILRRLHEKTAALAELGTFGSLASSLLVVRSTARTRDVARLYEATFAAAFPARTADAVAALTGSAPWPGAAIVWMEVEAGRARLLDRPPRSVRLGR